MEIVYNVLPTFVKVHKDIAPYIFVMGPVGSGKSSGCIFHLFLNAMKQIPDANGVRHSRYLVVRATYPALKSTVIKTWIKWFKDKITITYSTPIVARINYQLADGTSIDMEVFFIAVDDAQSAEKLRSLEVTGVHVNEASEIVEDVFQILKTRFNRYPAKQDGGAVDPFIIFDYNAVSTSHWLYRLAEEDKPDGHSFYKQPSAVIKHVDREGAVSYTINPHADNLDNLADDYYLNSISGSPEDFIQINLMNNYGELRSGRPVYKDYDDAIHVASKPITPMRGLPIIIGMDLGLTPAAIFTQQQYDGSIVVLDEIITDDCSIQEFAEELLWPMMKTKYAEWISNFTVVVDPAAMQRAMTDARSMYHVLKSRGLPVKLAKNNTLSDRLNSVIEFLRRKNGIVISPDCQHLRKGFINGYRYSKLNRSSDYYKEKPEKNEYSHIHDALQYAMMEYIHKIKSPTNLFRKPAAKKNSWRYEAASLIGGY